MIDSIDIRFGGSDQKIYLDAPEGRPSGVTSVSVWNDDEADTAPVEAAVGAPSVEAVTTTFDAASGYGVTDPEKCWLTATAGLVRDRAYLAANVAGEREVVEIERIVSGVAAHGYTPLTHTYASGDTFGSTRLEATIDASWVADVSNLSDPARTAPRYRAVWLYTVDSVVYRTAGYFDLVRYPFVYTVTPQDVDRGWPGWIDRLPTDYQRGQGARLIKEAAWQVKQDLLKRRRTDYAQRNSEVLNELVRRKAVFVGLQAAFLHGGGGTAQAVVDYAGKYYEDFLTQIVDEAQQQITPDGAGGTLPRERYWKR